MRRKDREIVRTEELMQIISQCKVCRLGLVDEGRPYVVPMNFGAEEVDGKICIYLHCATEGRRMDILRKNPAVCVEFDCQHKLLESGEACGNGFAYASVIGWGNCQVLEPHWEKAHGLEQVMLWQTGRAVAFTPEQTCAVAVLSVQLEEATGKRRDG